MFCQSPKISPTFSLRTALVPEQNSTHYLLVLLIKQSTGFYKRPLQCLGFVKSSPVQFSSFWNLFLQPNLTSSVKGCWSKIWPLFSLGRSGQLVIVLPQETWRSPPLPLTTYMPSFALLKRVCTLTAAEEKINRENKKYWVFKMANK